MQKPKIRLLENKEFEREDFKKLLDENDYHAVDPYTCKILIAEDENKNIVAALVTRPQFHTEPLIIDKKYQKSFLAVRMFRAVIELYKNYKGLNLFIFSHRRAINVASKRVGFQEMPYTVLRKEIQ